MAHGMQHGNRRDSQRDTERRRPEQPTDVEGSGLLGALKRTGKEFKVDNLADWAAALTYYGVLSIFPGLLVLVSLIGLAGQDTAKLLTDNLGQAGPGPVRDIITSAVTSLQQGQNRVAGLLALVGLATALWSASG